MKKIFRYIFMCLLLAVVLAVSVCAATVIDSGECGDGVTWTLADGGLLVISGTGDIDDTELPEELLPGIAPMLYTHWGTNCERIKTAIISDGVTSIGDYAFIYCEDLVSVEIPASVTSIGDDAFNGCQSLTGVTVYSRNATFGENIFYRAPAGLTIYGYAGSTAETYAKANGYTFVALEERTFIASGECGDYLTWGLYDDGELVISGAGAMWNWNYYSDIPWYNNYRSQIKTVTIESGVTSIGKNAFYYCTSLTNIDIPDDSVTSIGSDAFSQCINLTSVDIPDSVTSIGSYAFYYCTNLTKVTTYSRDTVFGSSVFKYTPSTFEIHGYIGSTAQTYANENSHTFIALTDLPGVIASEKCGDKLTWILYGDGELVISGTGDMDDFDFGQLPGLGLYDYRPWRDYASQIKTVTIADGVTSIGDYAFVSCENLESVDIPDSVTSIGHQAFSYCLSLKSVVIPDSVITIEDEAFAVCDSLESVEIGDGVTSIGSYAFDVCGKLATMTIKSRNAVFAEDAIYGDSSIFEIHAYAGSTAETYANENGYTFVALEERTFIASGECGDNLTWTLYDDGELVIEGTGETWNWNGSGNQLPLDANMLFPGQAYDIITVTIKSGVTAIGDCAFQYCPNLTSVTIPDSVTTIGSWAFTSCTSLTSVTIPDSVTAIGYEAFSDCDSLTAITIPNGVTSIGAGAFSSSGLTSIEIPNSVTSLGNSVFAWCSNLTEVKIYSKNIEFGKYVFDHCGSITLYGYAGSTAEAYANANGHTFVALDALDLIDLAGVTASLESTLSLDFAIDIKKLTGTDNYAEMTIVRADGTSETVTIPQSEWTKYSGSIYTAKFTGLAAKQMNDEITAVFYNAKGQQLTNARTESMMSNALNKLNGNAAGNAKLCTLYVDMLNYGAAAQEQFDYDVENLANRYLTEEQQAMATESIEIADNRVIGTGYAGTTLTLENEIRLDFIFKHSAVGKDYSKLYAIATYTDHRGTEKEVRIEGKNFTKYSSSLCQVSVTGMAVADYGALVSCTVYNTDGTALANASDSVESYACRNIELLAGTVETIVKFGVSSYAYFH